MTSSSKPLTPKQEAFAQAVAGGMSQSDAYRKAYNASNMSDQSVWVQASEVLANHKVSVRVAELTAQTRKNSEEKALWTREMSVKVLANIAVRGAKDSDRVRATRELNGMHGWQGVQKLEISGTLHHAPAYDYSQLDDNTLWALQRAKLPPA